MADTRDHLTDLDRHVELLETKVKRLRNSLEKWQSWYWEYSHLKEEVDQLPDEPQPIEDLRRIRRDFDSPLLTKKEINEIFGKHDLRELSQINSVLSRRMEYVEKNIETVERMLESEEEKLAAASVVADPEFGTDEESGLPLTEVIEHLGEEGNVVDFRLQSDSDAHAKVLEALKKAGIKEESLEGSKSETEAGEADGQAPAEPAEGEAEKSVRFKEANGVDSASAPEAPREGKPVVKKRKSVTFAEDTKPGDSQNRQLGDDGDFLAQRAKAVAKREELMEQARQGEAMDLSGAVMPEGEPEDERALRREMLEYMQNMGPVVAELTVEDDDFSDNYDEDDNEELMVGSGYGDEDEDEDDDYYDDEDDEDDDEDELGRSRKSYLTPKYIKRMQELEKRLFGGGVPFAVGGSSSEPEKPVEGVGQIKVVDVPAPATTTAPGRKEKSVSFASKLDIAPEAEMPRPKVEPTAKSPAFDPVQDVVEKTAALDIAAEPAETPKRVSRFKKERAAPAPPIDDAPIADLDSADEFDEGVERVSRFKKERAAAGSAKSSRPLGPDTINLPPHFLAQKAAATVPEPTPPEDAPLAHVIRERPTLAAVAEPDDDDEVVYQAAEAEYNRLRAQMMQKSGGPLTQTEPSEAPQPRVSKFKAARMSNTKP